VVCGAEGEKSATRGTGEERGWFVWFIWSVWFVWYEEQERRAARGWEGEAGEERVVARQPRRFSRLPGLLRGLLHRLSLAGEL
jgi:hypothetical protein